MAEKCHFYKILSSFLSLFLFVYPPPLAKRYCSQEERREKVKHEEENPKTALFGHILKKISTSTFGAWSLLLVHSRFTPSEVPKVL